VQDLAVEKAAPVLVDSARANNPAIRKKAGIRNGFANSTSGCIQPVARKASSLDSVECIITTRMIESPFA
jgi:hypothetical protein